MDLSAKMPAQMDSTLAAKMPATMKSEAETSGDNGSNDAPVVPIVRDSAQNDQEWESINDDKPGWETQDKKTGSEWELTDRKETDIGGRPQRDPDNDGDLN